MLKFGQTMVGVLAAAAVAVMPMAPAMADGHGFRGGHGFGVGRGLLGAAFALATLPLVVASSVVAGVSDAVAPASPGYAAPAYRYAPADSYAPAYRYAPPVAYAPARPYYAPYQGYYGPPRVAYGSRPYYLRHGYYRAGGNPYQRR